MRANSAVRLLALTVLLAAAAGSASGQQACDTHSGQPVPRFVSLRFEESVGRAGPSDQHPRAWIYQRAGLPVQVIQETPDWRKVRDPDGGEVWMHRRLLSSRRAVWALAEADLRARPEDAAPLVARIEPRAMLWLERCRPDWCRLEADGRRGWARATAFWGIEGSDLAPTGALEEGPGACYRSEPDSADPLTAG